MSGTPKSRMELAGNADSPFAAAATPSNQDFQDLAASFYNLVDDPGKVPLISKAEKLVLAQPTTTFLQSDGTRFFVDPGVADRNFNPSGAFTLGYEVEIVNIGGRNITFNHVSLVLVIPHGQSARIASDGVSFYKLFLG